MPGLKNKKNIFNLYSRFVLLFKAKHIDLTISFNFSVQFLINLTYNSVALR